MANTRVNIDVNINTSDAARNLRQLQAQINSFQSALNTNNRLQGDASRYYSQQIKDLANQSGMFSAETIKMRTAASQLDQTLSKGQGTMRQFISAKFLKDSAAAAQVLSLANSRASALQTQFVATGAAANGFREAVAIRPLQAFNSETAISAQKLAIHRAMLSQSTTSMINFGKNTQWAGRQLMVGFTVPLTIFAATAGKVFREIEKESLNFRKVYGDSFTTPEELNANLLAVQGLAKEYTKYGIAVKDTIGLAAQAAAAGSQGADLMDATTEATRLATLGQMDQNQALETTIALQTAFNLSGKDLSKTINFLNMVENQTVVTLQDLAQAIPRVAPVIKGLGGSVEDMAVMLAAMREGGITAAQGANALKSGLASLINPTDRAVESLDKMGINLTSIINMNRGDLLGTVKSFGEALATLDEFSRQQALEKVFGKYQYARLGALFNNIVKDGSQASRVMDTAALSAEQLAKSAEKELGAIEDSAAIKFVAAMEKLKLAIAPIGEMFIQMATPVLGLLGSLVDKFNELPDFAKKFIGFGTVITGIIIPAGTMFLGLLMNLAGTLTKFGLVVGVAFKGFSQGGLKGSVEAVSQALNFMSLAEIDAATASSQLGTSTEIVNAALRDQVPAAAGADAAIDSLSRSYAALIVQMTEAATLSRVAFVAPGAAMAGAAATGAEAGRRRGGPRLRRNFGGTIPGSGNTDTVPAMLTPGEFVVNKQATGENLALLHAINKGREVPGFNKGGQIPGMQYFGGRSPGGNVKQMDDAWKADQATFAGMFGSRGARRSQASNAASSRGSENIYNSLTGNYERGQNVRVDTLRYAVEKLGFNPQQLGLKTRGNLTFRMSKDSNLAMMRGDLTRKNLLKELETPDVYSPLSRQLDSYLGARLDTNAFDRIYREEIGKLPLTGINNGRFEKASRNAVRRYLDSAGFPKARRNSFIRDVLQGDTVNANMSLPAIKQALDARGIQYTSGQSKKDLYVDMDGRQINIGNLAGRESGNLGRPQGILDYAGLRGSGEAVHANKGGMIPGIQYANRGMLMKNFQRLSGRSQGLLPGWLTGTGGGLQKNDRKSIIDASSRLGRDVLDESMLSGKYLQRGHVAKGIKIDDEKTYHPGLMIWQSPRVNQGLKGGNSRKITGKDIYDDLKNTAAHPFSLQLEAARRLGIPDTISIPALKNSYAEALKKFRKIGKNVLGPEQFDNIFTDILKRNLPEELYNSLRMQGTSRLKSTGKSSGRYLMSETSQLNGGGMIPMLGAGGIAAAANAARGARGRIPANIVEWFSKMTTSISQSNRDDMLQNIPANIKRGLSTSRKNFDITRGSVDPISGGTLKDVSSWSRGEGVGRFMESSKLFDTMNNSKFQISGASQRMKRDLDSLKSLGPDGPRNSWSQFHQANGGLSLRLTPEEIQESGGVIWKANKKKLEERIRQNQEFIAGHQKIIDDLRESNIPTIYRTSVKKGEKYFDVSGRIVPKDDQRLNNPAASNAILEEKEVALLGARLAGKAKTRIVEREEAQARYDKAKEEIKRIRMAIFNKKMSAEEAKPDLDRLHDETENMAAFVNWGRGREVTYPSIVSRNIGGIIPQMRNIGGQIFDSTKTSRTIVPGVGNKDTVPAALTPGEFVINKDATRKNLDLLRAVNNGTIRGYAEGDIVTVKSSSFPDRKEIIRYMIEGFPDETYATKREAEKASKIIKAGKRTSSSKPNRMMGRGMGASMGLGAIGSTMMMAPMFLPGLQENATLSSAMPIAGAATTALSTLAMLPPPVAIAAAAITALGAAAIVTKTKFDEISRSAADAGSKLGGTANRMEKISAATGYQFAKDRVGQRDFRFSQQEGQDVMEFAPYFESESGQKLIEELKNLKAEDRYKEVGSIIAMAVADGMDLKTAKAYGQSIAFYTNDALLKFRLEGAFKRGEFRSGTDAMTQLIESRVQEASKIVIPEPPDSTSSPLSQALGTTGTTNLIGEAALSTLPGIPALLSFTNEMLEEQGNLFERLGKIDKGALLKQLIPGAGIVRLIQDGQEFAKTVEATGRVFGSSIQVLKEVDNLEAAIIEQRRKGSISADEYAAQIARVRQIQDVTSERLKEAFTLNQDTGLNQQAISSQLILGGFEEGLAGAVANQVNEESVGAKVFGEGNYKGTEEQKEVVAQVMTQVLSGLTPENAASRLADIETVYGLVAQQLLSAAADGVLTAAEATSIMLQGQIKNFVETALAVPDSGRLGSFRFPETTKNQKQNAAIETNLTELEKSGAFQEVGGLTPVTQRLSEFQDVNFARTISASADETKRFVGFMKELDQYKNIDIEVMMQTETDQDPTVVAKNIKDTLKAIGDIKFKSFGDNWKEMSTASRMLDPQEFITMSRKIQKAIDPKSIFKPEEVTKAYKETLSDLDNLRDNFKKSFDKESGVLKEVTVPMITSVFNEPVENAKAVADALNDALPDGFNPMVLPIMAQLMMDPKLAAILQNPNNMAALAEYINSGGTVDKGFRIEGSKTGTADRGESRTILIAGSGLVPSINLGGSPLGGGGGGGGGGGTKSIMEQLKEEFNNLKKIYNSMGQFINSKKGQFKGIMAGPFGPEFIEYLKSQGEQGLKILNGGINKIKAAYKAFKKVRLQNMSNFAQSFPATMIKQTQDIAIKNAFTERLDKAGFDAETSDQFIEGMGGVDAIRAYNQIKKKDEGKRTEDEQKAFEDMNKAIAQGGPAVKKYLSATTFDGASKSLKDMNHELDNTNKLLQMGYTKEEADQIVNLGDVSNLSAGQIKELGDSVKAYNLAVLASDPETLAQMKRDNAAEIRDIQRQIEEINTIRPLEDQVKVQQKIIDGQEKIVRVKQQEIDAIGRTIELKQRELEPLDDQIEKLQELSDKTSEAYDAQIEALDEVYKREENIAKLKQGQLDVAQALSRGDVAAAAQGALGMSQELARQSREEARSALESQKELATQNIQNKILDIEKQKKKINQDIEDLQMRQRVIQDDIYTIQSTLILPAENEIYRLQGEINIAADLLAEKYKNSADEMLNLIRSLDLAIKRQEYLNSITPGAKVGGGSPAAPATTTEFTPQTGGGGLVEVSPGNYILPGFGIVGTTTPPPPTTITQPTTTTTPTKIPNPFGLDFSKRMYGGKMSKYLMGGRVGYKGSTERAPGMMYGGLAKKYAYGSTVPGRGMTDKVPALLTPGEFVVRKRVAEQYGPLLELLNGQVFPTMKTNSFNSSSKTEKSGSMYNYNVNVTLNGSDMDANDVANAVIQKIKMTENKGIRSNNIRG